MSDPNERPTIKGTYVLSHIRALELERGDSALEELRIRFGRPFNYKNDDEVPVGDEVRLLECIVDIRSPKLLGLEERALAAGRLHFKNFSSTSLWRILHPIVKLNIRLVLMQCHHIAKRVFKGVIFTPESVNQNTVKIKLENNDYPLEHFQGFFEEWMAEAGHLGAVEAEIDPRSAYIYTITWR